MFHSALGMAIAWQQRAAAIPLLSACMLEGLVCFAPCRMVVQKGVHNPSRNLHQALYEHDSHTGTCTVTRWATALDWQFQGPAKPPSDANGRAVGAVAHVGNEAQEELLSGGEHRPTVCRHL
jgi:hypothetical protein